MVDTTSRKIVLTRDFKKKQTRQCEFFSTIQSDLWLHVQAHGNLVEEENSHFHKLIAMILQSSTEWTISTSLIQCITSVGICEQVHTSVLSPIFQQANVAGVGNLSKWRSEICNRCWSAPYFFKESPSLGMTESLADGPDWHLRSWFCSGLSLFSTVVLMLEMLNQTSLTKNKTSITQEPQLERSFPYYTESEHHFWWDMVVDDKCTHKNIRGVRKAFRATTLLAYSRGFLRSRIYPILWRRRLPLRASAPLHWRSPPW